MAKRKTSLKSLIVTFVITASVLAFLAALLVFFVPAYLEAFYGEDAINVDDKHLRLENIKVADEENMYFDLKRLRVEDFGAYQKFIEIRQALLGEDDYDATEFLALLDKNKASLEIFDIAALKDKYQNPSFAGSEESGNILDTSLNVARNVSQLSLSKAFLLASEGAEAEALKEIMKSLKIGNAIIVSQSSVVEYLVGLSLYGDSLSALLDIIGLIEDYDVLRLVFDEIKEMEIYQNSSYVKIDYNFSKNLIEEITSENHKFSESFVNRLALKNKYYYKKNQTINMQVEEYTKTIQSIERNCHEKEAYIIQNPLVFGSLKDFPKLYFEENVIGKILVDFPGLALYNVENKRCELKMKKVRTELLLANYLYELENKKEPQSVEDLVPEYFKEIKLDPLSGERVNFSD